MTDISRRRLLSALCVGGTVGIAGCGAEQGDTEPVGTEQNSPDDRTVTTTPDDTLPTILSYAAEPRDNGERLAVELEGEDNHELSLAKIAYGDSVVRRQLSSEQVQITDELTKIPSAASESPGQVTYLLRDQSGNEVTKTATPDDTSPSVSFTPRATAKAGGLGIKLQATDDVGLATVELQINDETHTTIDATGASTSTFDQSISATNQPAVEPGAENTTKVVVSDAFGNTTTKTTSQYVRKYNVFENTRVSLGTVYQPYFGFKNKLAEKCWDERVPTVGHYERPIPFEVFNRHIDQMTGHGIDRVMIEFLGNETGKHDKRFLEADLIDEVQIEPFYTAAPNLWKDGYWSTVDSYRDDLVKPHMKFMREHILSKDNVTTIDGRPVIQMWNSVTWALDYEYGRIVEEWGGYDDFFDEIRSLLTVNGKEPFFVGGTNWWGHGGYPEGRKAELTKHFDATTTWKVGSELHDGFASQETALRWVEENWRGHRNFTDDHGMEFVPMVFPGFDERTSNDGNCDLRDAEGKGRRIPRSPEFFRDMLELADEYRTTKLVNNSVYNNWQEGTHIEPGVFEPGPFGERNYGTAYLDVVSEFQQA